MKRFIFLLMVLIPCLVFGQKPTIEFEETSYNFGKISENGGKVTHVFVFKNTGTTPLILTNVRAGCGCTTPEWNRQPVAPGAKGSIKISFDPSGRPDLFTKSITVNSNATNSVVSLTIRGNVSRKNADPYAKYTYSIGTLKLMNNILYFGNLKNTELGERNMEIINSGDQPITVGVNCPSPALNVTISPVTLQKGQQGTLRVKYDPQKKNDWGFVSDLIEITIDNKEKGTVQALATITEDFSFYNNNFDHAPVIALSETEYTMPDLTPNSTYTRDLYIQNNGKSDLIIRYTKPSDTNISVHIAKNIVKPGKKVKATLTFKTNEKRTNSKVVQFTTNDPQNTTVSYKLTSILK